MTSAARKRVLIADDDPAIVRMLEKVLGQEYQTVVATTGAEAIARALETVPDLVLLDVMMPAVDGFRVATELRKDPQLAKTRIVFLTAKDGPLDMVRGIQVGARHYLTKPFKLEEVRDRIRRALR